MYKVGKNNISPQQNKLLADAKTAEKAQDFYGIRNHLYRIATDLEISIGQEEVHPDWQQLIENSKKHWLSSAPKNVKVSIDNLLNALQTPGHNLVEINPSTDKIVFLLGAGISKPSPSDIPTVKELLKHMLDRARRLDRPDLANLETFCEREKIDNIEDLLTAAQMATFCSKNPTVRKLMDHLLGKSDGDSEEEDFFPLQLSEFQRPFPPSSPSFLQDTLQVLFALLSNMMLPAKPNTAHSAIANFVLGNNNGTIITTNYDCCMDLALGAAFEDFSYALEFARTPSTSEKRGRGGPNSGVKLVKLHGSLNWHHCETCQEIHLQDARATIEGFLTDQSPYPVIGICRKCGGQHKPMLVPPLSMKFDVAAPLSPLLDHARQAFQEADVTMSVGFSFAEADLYIFRLIGKSMQTNSTQKLVILDLDRSVCDRVRRRLSATIPNFDESRVLDLVGDCTDLLPRFLAGDYHRKTPGPKSEKKNKQVRKKASRR